MFFLLPLLHNLFILVSFLLSIYTLTLLRRLCTNYTAALRTGLPILFIPFYPLGLPWHLVYHSFGPLLGRFRCCRLLAFTWGWEDDDKWHRELGDSFVLVGVDKCILHTSDCVAVEWVLARRKEFPKPGVYEGLDLFGKNVDTVNGAEWARHRKITAPCFNERVSSFVWSEAVRQSHSMLTTWLSSPTGKITNMVDDTRIVALHVLYAAGFGASDDFHSGKRVAAPGHQLSHRDALLTILENLVTAILLVKEIGLAERWKAWLGKRMRTVLLAVKEFRMYTDEAIAAEREVLAKGQGEAKHNLMSTLIRTSDQAKAEGAHSAVRLTDDEIKGNIFIFNLAGHDTTANTLGYAFALLACHGEIQDWVTEELDEVFADGVEGKYEDVFPRLKRVMAVMYETLRLYGPVSNIPRSVIAPNTPLLITNPDPKSKLTTPTATILMPPNTEIALKTHAMHTTPAHFPAPKTWNPKRWITTTPSSEPGKCRPKEELVHSKAFYPWSAGPRICPGMKMAQVEFVAVLSTVLRAAGVAAGVRGKEEVGTEVARKTLMALIRDSNADGPTLKMTRPEEVCISVVARRREASLR